VRPQSKQVAKNGSVHCMYVCSLNEIMVTNRNMVQYNEKGNTL